MKTELTPKPIGEIWKIVLGGALAILAAAAMEFLETQSTTISALRVLLTLAGALAIGIGLYLRPGHAVLYSLACVMAVLARFGFPADWDSGRIVSGLGAIIAGVGAVLTALPTHYRKVAASVLVLLHFGGILAAVTAPPSQPWLSSAFGVLIYRPYLQSVYLTNAYHFYSPEPGPASQVWFCIKYQPDANGVAGVRWYKFPRRPEDMTDPLGLSYYRRLSLTMRLEDAVPFPGLSDDAKRARVLRAQGDNGIPIHPEFIPLDLQYRLPQDHVRDFVLPSYVRHVASQKEWQHDDGKTMIESIKVYLVQHRILEPMLMQQGMTPYDPTTYLPYYMGEFDTEGQLVQQYDPLLYWLIPIYRIPDPNKEVPPWHTPRTNPDEFIIIDAVKRHTGSDHTLIK